MMGARSAGWFFAGFATGTLVIVIVLWAGGRLHAAAAQPSAMPAVPARAAAPQPVPPPRPQVSRLPEAPPAIPPQVIVPPTSVPQADRQMPDAAPGDLAGHNLLTPVEGVRPQSLVDTFDEARSQGRRHDAIDIMAPRGTPVVAADEGNVVKLFNSKQGGLTVYQFDDSRTWCYYYAHLDRYEPGLKEGMLLRKGERLGYVGFTGDASPDAPHLHFAIYRLGPDKRWWEGTAINPFPLLAK